MEQVMISLDSCLKDKAESTLKLWGMTWAELIENAINDPFYSEKNLARIQQSIAELDEGKVVVKTMAELETLADE